MVKLSGLRIVFIPLFVFLFMICQAQTVSNPPNAHKEFRAAWVATVANINWPSKPGLSNEEQQKEALTLLDFLKDHHFNAVIFQIRPMADALYKSDLEPWSYYLTGEQGKAPVPFYDPLQFWVEAAHDRGLELHVWLNPYRAYHPTSKEISEKSIVKTNPEQVRDLVRGIGESGEWAQTHRLQAAKVAAPYFRQKEKLLDFVLTDPGRVSYTTLTPTDPEMQQIGDMALKVGILKKPISLKDMVDREFIPASLHAAEIKVTVRRPTAAPVIVAQAR